MLCRMCEIMLTLDEADQAYCTPKNGQLQRKPSQVLTCIVQQPTSTSTRRGPDDYEPVNLRHALEETYEYGQYVDIDSINKKDN